MPPVESSPTTIGSWFALILAGLSPCAKAEDAAPAKASAGRVEFFESKIRPLFVEECFRCHSAEAKKLKGDLHLDTRAGMLKGGESGAARHRAPAKRPTRADQSRRLA